MDDRARAIERIYQRRYAGFRRAISAVVGDYDRAHDVVQEAFARALARRETFRGGSLEAWIWRIVVRKACDQQRGERLSVDANLDARLVPVGPDPELGDAIRALPPRRRLVVFLRYYGDLSYEQIAELCAVSLGTVGATLAQAHAELRTMLETKGSRQ